MPIFEFICYKCGKKKEKILDNFEEVKQRKIICEECNIPMKYIMSVPNFHLIGKGWAKDGYGN